MQFDLREFHFEIKSENFIDLRMYEYREYSQEGMENMVVFILTVWRIKLHALH